ncbi:ubiquitin hydrolase, putative [Trypanosoma cruzi marinkellei]|uniref:Ubiquitin hydrolase, putative n=1 Tax=Trypanosoma cruzi marinkellei TaxID=85056 RepID=K2MXD9_TRYCR|nr:ubiquitin hydrolase, putative [Trypanosoma cruzi marinkellei]
MVCTSGNASSHCSFSSMQQQQNLLFGVERLMTSTYPPARFEPRPTTLLKRKIDVINCITRRVRRISQGLMDGKCSFENRRALAHTIVHSALQAAYPNCRRDIFVASPCEEAQGSSLHADTIAEAFLCDTATYADPLIYASVLSSFIVYGVDFASSRHGPRVNSAGSNNVIPPLPSLDAALYCLHKAVKAIYVKMIMSIGGPILRYADENNILTRKPCPGEFIESFHALANGYTLISLLRFFAEEEVVEGGNAGEETATADPLHRDKPLRYTTAVLYRLFDAELGSASHEASLSSSSPSSSPSPSSSLLLVPSISSTFASGFKSAINAYSAAGIKWNLSNKTNLKEARKLLFHFPPLVRAMVVLMAYYCRHFPALYHSVVKIVEAPFILDQFVHSALLYFPMRSQEEMERERSMFCVKKNRSLVGTVKQVTESEPANDAWPKALTTLDSGESGGAHPEEEETLFPELLKRRRMHVSWQTNSMLEDRSLPKKTALLQSTETRELPFACVGLLNVGNTCFVNSFTQLFFAARHFRMDLLRETTPRIVPLLLSLFNETAPGDEDGRRGIIRHRPITGPQVTTGFVLLMLQMHWMVTHGHSGGVVDTRFFRDVLPEPFNDGFQHDASEYGKVLMELLDNSSASEALWNATSVVEEEEDDYNNNNNNTVGRRAYSLQQECEEYEHKTKRNREEQESLGGGRFTANSLPANAQTQTEINQRSERKRNGHGGGNGVGVGLSTVVARWFGGVTASLIECMACHHTRTQLSPFWDISVPLRREEEEEEERPRTCHAEVVSHERENLDENAHVLRSEDGHIAITNYYAQDADAAGVPVAQGEEEEEETRQQPSLQELLESVLNYQDSGELLHGDNMTYCESCRRREPVILRTAVHTTCRRALPLAGNYMQGVQGQLQEKDIEGVPFYLTLQLNRFQYVRETGNHEKVMDKVTINKVISLPVRVAMRGMGRMAEEDEEDVGEVVHERIHYRLIAVLVHSGSSPRSGHYFTLLRSHMNAENAEEEEEEEEDDNTRDSWVLANDSIVSFLNAETAENVLSGASGIFGRSETPYIILYERCEYLPPATDDLDIPAAIEQLLRELVKPGNHAPPPSEGNKGNDRDDHGGDGGSGGDKDSGADIFGPCNTFWDEGAPIF